MKQIIPFSKDITFKTKIGDITGISLDNDLTLKGEDLITGSFYIKGTYKMLKTSSFEEEYSYKIPCDIAISDNYDAFDCTLDIDNFTYEVIDDETLRVKIDVLIDNLKEKEEVRNTLNNIDIEEPKEEIAPTLEEYEISKKETPETIVQEKEEIKKEEQRENILQEKIINIPNKEEIYKIYSIYIVREGDTLEKIANDYKVEITDIENYNDITNIKAGVKLVIPSI